MSTACGRRSRRTTARCSSSRRRSRTSNSTLHRLLLIELVVTGARARRDRALGLWLVRLGLRPLDAIGETASAIAAGDLSRRVERAEERTEVGRLGLALNAMLARIESSFRAQEASERKLRRFVADASHELRTPLSAVRAYAELYDRGAAERPDDLERSMRGISRESERMSVLVDDLLLLARLDDGRPLEREPVELDEVVGEAVETAQAVDPERRDRAPRRSRRSSLGDRVRLRQIVDNLLANVRAHTPPGHACFGLGRRGGTARPRSPSRTPGRASTRSISQHVFERFYRADPSRARASGGVGLGLAIVAAVAEAHGGTASASSAPGRGDDVRDRAPARRRRRCLTTSPNGQPAHRPFPACRSTLGARPADGPPSRKEPPCTTPPRSRIQATPTACSSSAPSRRSCSAVTRATATAVSGLHSRFTGGSQSWPRAAWCH